ncbi:MAG: caspase family protein, partial [Spirochaetes bacterium]|nr:caspase family protein [Spirochaetota bacterium]
SYSPKISGNSASFLGEYEKNRSAVVSNNGQFALFGADWDIYCLDGSGNLLWEKPVPGMACAVNISGDDKLVVATLDDGTIRWYNATTGRELLALFVHSATKRWVMWTPEGYFDHSPGGEQLVGFHINRGYDKEAVFLPVDKFYDTYYRPDIILASIEGKDISTIAKNDINKGIKLPPEITIITKTVVDGSERGLKLTQKKADFTFDYDNIAADLKAVDQGGGIKRIRFYLNDKMIVEDDNITIKSGVFERSYQITLQSGFNVLKAVGYSEDGTESNGFVITYQVNKKVVDKPNMYIVGIGINKYKNSQYNLEYCIPDVDGFISAISPKSQKLFNNVIVSKIYDNEANKANILAQFNDLKSKIKPEDVFIMYYSGHGVALAIDDVNTEFFYVLHNVVQMTNLNFANKEAISGTELRGLLKDIKATKQVVFVDACNSGAFTDLFAMKGAAEENALAKLSKASGTVIFASTNADQFATEFHVLGHGIFTYTLLDGLLDNKAAKSNGQITVSSLNDFLYEQFPVFTKKYKGSEQYPKTFIFGQDFPIGIK